MPTNSYTITHTKIHTHIHTHEHVQYRHIHTNAYTIKHTEIHTYTQTYTFTLHDIQTTWDTYTNDKYSLIKQSTIMYGTKCGEEQNWHEFDSLILSSSHAWLM